jgi:hypothetical protein
MITYEYHASQSHHLKFPVFFVDDYDGNTITTTTTTNTTTTTTNNNNVIKPKIRV